jgi:1-phosphofructokinase
MIYTCTLNPAIDYRLLVSNFEVGKLNRSSSSIFMAGGKSINVSIVLNELNTKNIATGFLGGFTGQYLKQYLIENLKLDTNFIEVSGFTRINVKLLSNDIETEINQESPNIEDKDFQKLTNLIDHMETLDILICGGSSVKGIDNIYEKIAIHCQKKKIEFIIDTTKSDLAQVLPYGPLLVKPNIHELQEFFGVSIRTLDETIKYGKKLLELGAKNAIVSLGGKGSIFVNKDLTLRAKALVGEVKNPVGAGDSMVAGFISSYTIDKDIIKAYKLAIACASATAFSPTIGTRSEIDALLPSVEIENI